MTINPKWSKTFCPENEVPPRPFRRAIGCDETVPGQAKLILGRLHYEGNSGAEAEKVMLVKP